MRRAPLHERVSFHSLRLAVELELVDAPLELDHDLGRLVLRARNASPLLRIVPVGQVEPAKQPLRAGGRHVVGQAEEIPMDFMAEEISKGRLPIARRPTRSADGAGSCRFRPWNTGSRLGIRPTRASPNRSRSARARGSAGVAGLPKPRLRLTSLVEVKLPLETPRNETSSA
jgi:hypothetical protein